MSNQRKSIEKILIFIYPIHNYNRRDIGTIYIYNKTSLKRNILAIKHNTYNHISIIAHLTIHNTNGKQQQRNVHETIIENEITTTTIIITLSNKVIVLTYTV